MGIFFRKKENDRIEYSKISKWLDCVLSQDVPNDVVAFCFNLYDDGENNWSMELVGTQQFDADDADWACDEVTDFGTRENTFAWKEKADWDVILEEVISALKEYLNNGERANVLKSGMGIGVGFVDGDMEIL